MPVKISEFVGLSKYSAQFKKKIHIYLSIYLNISAVLLFTIKMFIMKYYTSVTIKKDFEKASEAITEALQKNKFGIVSTINMHEKFKEKLQKNFRKYRILGACNPAFAYEAVQLEPHVGILLPCNVVVQEESATETTISIIDPVSAMQVVENPALEKMAVNVRNQLTSALEMLA